jgi:hypothetical protein
MVKAQSGNWRHHIKAEDFFWLSSDNDIGFFRAFGDPVTGLENYDFNHHLLGKDKAFAE